MSELLESCYESMNQRNAPSAVDPCPNPTLGGYCYAAYALGGWYLEPAWIRLQRRLCEILESTDTCVYTPIPDPDGDQGRLHQTLLQYESFDTAPSLSKEHVAAAAATVRDILQKHAETMTIQYRGIVWTRTGLALAGYPTDPEGYKKLMQLREKIQMGLEAKGIPFTAPYHNDICHATLLRWRNTPSVAVQKALEKEVIRWSETVFGHIHIREWCIGKASWQMRHEQREDFYKIPLHSLIAHRGNLDGPKPREENNPMIVRQRLQQGFSVECDVWYKQGELWLGHDAPEYAIRWSDLLDPRLLIHAKDGPTLEYLLHRIGTEGVDMEVFYHTTEDYILTNKGRVIVYPGKALLKGSLCMMPERASYNAEEKKKAAWICSDSITSAFTDELVFSSI